MIFLKPFFEAIVRVILCAWAYANYQNIALLFFKKSVLFILVDIGRPTPGDQCRRQTEESKNGLYHHSEILLGCLCFYFFPPIFKFGGTKPWLFIYLFKHLVGWGRVVGAGWGQLGSHGMSAGWTRQHGLCDWGRRGKKA